jgi:hypothetical protein
VLPLLAPGGVEHTQTQMFVCAGCAALKLNGEPLAAACALLCRVGVDPAWAEGLGGRCGVEGAGGECVVQWEDTWQLCQASSLHTPTA